MRRIRKLRHWKQQFDKDARFVWRRETLFAGTIYEAGTVIPDDLIPKAKLRRFWEAGRIELYKFEDPDVATGARKDADDELVIPEGVTVEKAKGSWFLVKIVGDEKDYKVNGKKALAKFIDELPESESDEIDSKELSELLDLIELQVTAEDVAQWSEEDKALVTAYIDIILDDSVENPEEPPEILADLMSDATVATDDDPGTEGKGTEND